MPFSPKTLDFLFENRLHDSRDWFLEHRGDYQRLVLEPLQELAAALAPGMLELDDQLTTDPRVDRTICRIRRDTRFSHDKSLYRDNMWIIFKRGRMHGTQAPGLYFEINGRGFEYGCGFYDASASYMERLRRMALQGAGGFPSAKRAYERQGIYRMEGTCYKRPHYPQQPPALREWLERRNISFVAESGDFDLLFSDRLADKLTGDFRLLRPIYRFLLETALEEQRAAGPSR